MAKTIDYPNQYFKITPSAGVVVLLTESGNTCKGHLLDENSKHKSFEHGAPPGVNEYRPPHLVSMNKGHHLVSFLLSNV